MWIGTRSPCFLNSLLLNPSHTPIGQPTATREVTAELTGSAHIQGTKKDCCTRSGEDRSWERRTMPPCRSLNLLSNPKGFSATGMEMLLIS